MDRRSKWIIYGLATVGGFIAIAVCVLISFRISGRIQFYNVPTNGNDPGIPAGSYLLATSLKEPARHDFLCYWQTDPAFERAIWIQRLCGMPGDTLNIVDGVLHVNGKDIDAGLRLKHRYRIPSSVSLELFEKELYDVEDVGARTAWDSMDIFMEDHIMLPLKNVHRVLSNAADTLITAHYHEPWTQDRFGPLVVPEDCYFLLGDNRNASIDSRYVGVVHKSDVVGVMFHVF